jgi:hypothetical protein
MGRADIGTGSGTFCRQLLGQVLDADQAVMAEDEGALDDVLELTNIARPVVSHEQRQGFGLDTLDRPALQAIEAADEMLDQERQILLAAAQRRQLDADHVDTVVEVLAQRARADLLGQVLVGGDDDAGVGGLGAGGAERS